MRIVVLRDGLSGAMIAGKKDIKRPSESAVEIALVEIWEHVSPFQTIAFPNLYSYRTSLTVILAGEVQKLPLESLISCYSRPERHKISVFMSIELSYICHS